MLKAKRVIGVDVGGTKVLAGIVGVDGTVERTVEHPTETASEQALLDQLESMIRSLLDDGVEAVGIGVPSQIDQRRGVALGSVNLPLDDLPLRDELGGRLSLPVGVENDANAAAFAESRFGAGRGVDDMVLLTLGTGVGGGVIMHGSLYRGWAELGHMVIVADGEPCFGSCTGRGHFEAYCSGTAAHHLAMAVLGPDATAHDLIVQRHPALDGLAHYLGVALGSLVNIFGAELAVIGGGFGLAAYELLLPAARRALVTEALAGFGEKLRIEPAQLGEEAGLVGAALVGLEAAAV